MANFEPLPFRRQFGGNTDEKAHCSNKPMEESPFIDVSGSTVVRPIVTGACRKCGYVGHLAYQCRNFLQPKGASSIVLDVSSTSSESESETPLVSKDEKGKKHKKKHKKELINRKRRSSHKLYKHEKKKKRRKSISPENKHGHRNKQKHYHHHRSRSTS
uniref:Protein SREK1IP1 n=1 Tax=Syphacia muris TaxID=451379 RepID=A0A0N5AR93_9BILA